MGIPGYWMDETTGVLRPAIEAYVNHRLMRPEHIVAMRAYLRQWIASDVWAGPDIERLRADVDGLTSREAIDAWIERATEAGLDPL